MVRPAPGARREPAAEPPAPARRGRLLRPPLHGLERLHARALGDADRPLHPPDRLHDHGRQHARSGLSRPGGRCCAITATTPGGTASGTSPTTTTSGRRRRAGRCSRTTASRAAPTPRPTAAPARAGASTRSIARQFEDWFAHEGGSEPWCTTVSFVNPHDIAWWYKWTDRVPAEAQAPSVIGRAAAQLRDAGAADRAQQAAAAAHLPGHLGRLLRAGRPSPARKRSERWLEFLDLYMKIQLEVDRHIGRVLQTLAQPPGGGGEHGDRVHLRSRRVRRLARAARQGRLRLRGGHPRAAARQGSPRRAHQRAPNACASSSPRASTSRRCCSRSAAAPNDWRRDPHYSHIAGRADLAGILADPAAPGRPYILHATDEIVTEYAIEPYAADAPLHVVALRTPAAKLATYSNWPYQGIEPLARGRGTRAV